MCCLRMVVLLSSPGYIIEYLYAWYQAEINYLGQLHHPNLVKLIGYCLDGENLLLVYEFMPKGSLENHLFRSKFANLAQNFVFAYSPCLYSLIF